MTDTEGRPPLIRVVAGPFLLFAMSLLRIEYDALDREALTSALHQALPDVWSRDGILEHQITTQDPVQLCFRREQTETTPRAAICLAGDTSTLTDAAIIPVDRGPELSDDQRKEIARDFAENVLETAFSETSSGVTWRLEG